MKHIFTVLFFALAAVFLLKAEDKPPAHRQVPANELYEVRYTIAALNYLSSKKLTQEEFHKDADPLQAQQQAWIANECKLAGVPQDRVQAECRWNLGLDGDGKPMNGADGKPVMPEFWRELPKEEPKK